MESVVIVAAGRTGIGKFGGMLSRTPATEMGAHLIRTLLLRIGLASEAISEVILGQVLTAGCGQNPARQSALGAGLPDAVPGFTVNKVCGSGLKAVHLATQAILCGDADIVIAGGQENMSLAPHVMPHSRSGTRLGDIVLKDTVLVDGLLDAYHHYHMGVTAENIAKRYGFSREEQDEYACESHRKAAEAQQSGRFDDEIIPMEITDRRHASVFARDEYIRPGTTRAALAALSPAFTSNGTVTAGNASGINDGAAVVILMKEFKAAELGLPVLARIKAYSSAGVDPAFMGLGPIPATRLCLQKAGWTHEDVDLMEINEAFAVQALAINRDMGWDPDKINVNGGAIALGHPIGASGCRLLVTLLHEMKRRDAKRGLTSLCIGGGMGVALAIER
ncbi:acetyl-CoA C-acetyltransferase [Oxalicibacterium faecigallinarum]|uniref:Acetyl-CoA acetyltransferase n=1 Tax=Oxalicibacterium faecigallinarum TaxID=573741 RepID=A0A8J3AU74_9BURK|nr:acetyl-CoA C-acetyltransferase [Oxalicibacterium faecigallinarum]GGI18772.1 acetyl-CoA acetyltransferase [Oxalicibacterium faecigallinarum]